MGYKKLQKEAKFKIVSELVQRNVEITRINSIIKSLMQISEKSDAYRIFMIYVCSGRKMEQLGDDSGVFDYMISLLIKVGRMDEAERVCIQARVLYIITRAKRSTRVKRVIITCSRGNDTNI
jgi:hypothetical protein